MEQANLETKPSLSLRRHYPVAPEKVWRAWTDPEALKRWWGPGGQDPVALAELDVRVGGRFRMVFGGAQGKDHECAGIYKEVVRHKKLVFTWCWPNSTPERVSQVTILFKKAAGGTDLEFRHEQFFDAAARDGHLRGWTETFVKLESYLVGEKPTLTVTREYPVAPEKVWRAWTDPQALGQWFRPDASFSVPVAEADVRAGGRFRVLMVDAKGEEFDLSGFYREVVPARKLVMTWGWKNQPGHESLVTVNFLPAGKGTKIELQHEGFLDFENQPTHEQGWNGALDKLGQLLGESHGLR
jgi:uncharacterized protein YndB with AHSA1/START domain